MQNIENAIRLQRLKILLKFQEIGKALNHSFSMIESSEA